MLNIFFGLREDTIMNVDTFFDHEFEDVWMQNSMVREMILDVDKSEVLDTYLIKSPVLGHISPYMLSGGVKALILMLFEPEYVYDGSACGDNCARWILEIAEKHDLELDFGHTMRFPEPFKVHILNDDTHVTNIADLASAHNEHDRGLI